MPLDSVAAVGTSAFKTISITSASGAIKFGMIRNFQEIHSEISKLLVERQAQKQTTTQTTIKQEIPQSNADELKKFKKMCTSTLCSIGKTLTISSLFPF